MHDGTQLIATYVYDDSGRLEEALLGNGIRTTYGFDGLNITSLNQYKPNQSLLHAYSFQYDANRNMTARQENAATYQFAYDKLNRIETSELFNESYAYTN